MHWRPWISVPFLLLVMISGHGHAAQTTPHAKAFSWGQFILAEANPADTGALDRTRVKAVWSNLAGVPPTLTLYHSHQFKARLRVGALALVPVQQINDRWHVFHSGVRQIGLQNVAKPIRLLDVLERWPTIIQLPQRQQLESLLKMVDHRLPFAQAAARERLLALFASPNRPQLTPSQLAASASVISARSRPLPELRRHLRFLGRLDGALTAKWVAERFYIDFPNALRADGIRLMGRYQNDEIRGVLSRCLNSERSVFARSCARWLGKR